MPSFAARSWNTAVTSLVCAVACSSFCFAADRVMQDLTQVGVLAVDDGSLSAKAAELLRHEIERRTGIRVPTLPAGPEPGVPAIIIRTRDQLHDGQLPDDLPMPSREDAYAIWVERSGPAPRVHLLGYDQRATLYAAGRLLRLLVMTDGQLELPADVRLSCAPDVAIRGHQLGYRDTANSYDAWDVNQYEQYIRDQIVFGANAIELIPPSAAESGGNRHMPLSPWDMNRELCALIASYGLDVWLWVPVEGDVEVAEQAEEELSRRRTLFQSCPQISHIFVPGGDPGDTPPEILLPWLSRLAEVLHETHPEAGLWVSNQGFTPEQNEFLYGYLRGKEPDWLEGIVFGPWVKHSLAEARARTPRKYRLRRYPDICHTLRCQYPVPDWDPAFSQSLGREPYNPRPRAMAHIHNAMAHLADGFVTYSDGVTDDVNKVIWNACGWDTEQSVEEILVEYGRYFIGEGQGRAVAEGLLALEDNWRGPLLDNAGIDATLAHWQDIARQNPEAARTNWRLQLPLLRAHYDAYLQRRLRSHAQIEHAAIEKLREASEIGVRAAIDEARRVLAEVDRDDTAHDLRMQLIELGRLLFRSVGLQSDTPNYAAANPERGAILDFLDFALNDRPWLESQFAEILALDDEQEQHRRIERIAAWEDPGPGGFYDDLGRVGRQPHLLPTAREDAWNADPGFVGTSQSEFSNRVDRARLTLNEGRISWSTQGQTLFDTPLRMRYTDLDPTAPYRLRVSYAGRFRATMRLVADQRHEIHGPLAQPSTPWPMEFDIPRVATADGTLDLQWELLGGRGCQVAEVWLLRQ